MLLKSGIGSQLQKSIGQLVEGGLDGFAPGHDHNIKAGAEPVFVQPVYFPEAAADTVADVGLSQFFTDGDTNPVDSKPVGAGIKHQIPIGLAMGPIKPLKDVIQFQTL